LGNADWHHLISVSLSPADLEQQGRGSVADFVFVSGNAYVGHPSSAGPSFLCTKRGSGREIPAGTASV
jgi:hypothetical protein